MKKTLVILSLFSSLALARELTATKECEAYNNLKHTKNSQHALIKAGQTYQILRQQKGNYFVKIDNAKPRTRWVDIDCFDSSTKKSKSSIFSKLLAPIVKRDKPTQRDSNLKSVLVVSWHNTFCENHSNKRECKRDGGDAKNHLVLHGLWPQPRGNEYCGVSSKIKRLDRMKRWSALPKLELSKQTKELMQIYMPGYESNLQRHEWYKHGTCYSNNPDSYFKTALSFTKELDESIGEYLRDNLGKKINLYNIKRIAKRKLAKDIDNKIALKCKGRVIKEIWISLSGKGDSLESLIKDAKSIRSNCSEAIVDKAGKYRR